MAIFTQMGNKPHASTAMMAQEYGPLISLRLGSRLLVVASSPEAAMEVLKTQDHEHGNAHWLKVAHRRHCEGVDTNVSDPFPVLKRLDLQGLRKAYLKHLLEVSSFTDTIIDERRDRIASSAGTKVVVEEKDFLDRLLENNFTNTQINILALVSQSFPTIHVVISRDLD
ncbi:cytochrome P450 [Tanacetum coccineum]